jgi:hypothetical protein
VPVAASTPTFVVKFFQRELPERPTNVKLNHGADCFEAPLMSKAGARKTNLPGEVGDASFVGMNARRRRDYRVAMREGDRILINKGISKKVMIIARTEIPHSTDRIFVTKSGGKYTIGLKVWKSDYTWNEKNQMWVPKQ